MLEVSNGVEHGQVQALAGGRPEGRVVLEQPLEEVYQIVRRIRKVVLKRVLGFLEVKGVVVLLYGFLGEETRVILVLVAEFFKDHLELVVIGYDVHVLPLALQHLGTRRQREAARSRDEEPLLGSTGVLVLGGAMEHFCEHATQ